MRMKALRATLLLTMALAVLVSLVPARAQAAGYSVRVNGAVVGDAMAELRSGQLTVSVRPFVEAMGGTVTWTASAQRVDVAYRNTAVALWLGTHTVYQNGTKLWAPVAPYLKDSKTMVPAWWLAAQLGAKVRFDGSTLYVDTPQPALTPTHPLMKSSYFFPYAAGAPYSTYWDTWGDDRYFEGQPSRHEGTDIAAPKGTPIVAVAGGTVVRYGWNTLGGYRLTVQLDDNPGYRFYYAHMDRYANGIYQGAHVRAGQVLGYTGSTGEGPERTEGKFITHLHFGIYGPDGSAINPYPFLKYWENHKINL